MKMNDLVHNEERLKQLLDSLYEDDRMKIQTDIAVLKTLLSQEGLVDDGLHM